MRTTEGRGGRSMWIVPEAEELIEGDNDILLDMEGDTEGVGEGNGDCDDVLVEETDSVLEELGLLEGTGGGVEVVNREIETDLESEFDRVELCDTADTDPEAVEVVVKPDIDLQGDSDPEEDAVMDADAEEEEDAGGF